MATLTDKVIKGLKPQAKRYEVSDDHCKGLRIRVQPDGTKVFATLFRSANGKFVRATLGEYGLLTLAEAREAANDARREDHQNGGPVLKFEDAVANFMKLYSQRRNRPSTIEANERLLTKHFIPEWMGRDVKTITKKNVVAVLDEIARDAPSTADHALSAVRKLFYWLETRGDIDRCPASRLPKYNDKDPRDRALKLAEVAAVWMASEAEGYPFGWCVQLLILTGQRPSEVVELPWSELVPADQKAMPEDVTPSTKVEFSHWLLPKARAKNKVPNLIPLTPAILAQIERIRARHQEIGLKSPYLFPNERDVLRPMLATTQRRDRIRDAAKVADWTLHDLRRTVRTGLAKLRVPADAAERLLNHVPDIVRRTYDIHDYEPEKRDALERWQRYLETVITISDQSGSSGASQDREINAGPLGCATEVSAAGLFVADDATLSIGGRGEVGSRPEGSRSPDDQTARAGERLETAFAEAGYTVAFSVRRAGE